jgi:hypothetical protein
LLDAIREAFLWLKCFFEIFFRSDRLSLHIDKLESEISHHPHEGWEVLSVFFRVNVFLGDTLSLKLDVSCQVDH